MRKTVCMLAAACVVCGGVWGQSGAQKPDIKSININTGNGYYSIYYKDTKPDDVPQAVYDALWEIQKEVIDNFTYDYAAMRDRRKIQHMTTKEEFYQYGRGVCENYASFFILLAREKGLLENLYKVSGDRKGGSGHAWLEYRTAENTYIIDPTWSDDFTYTEGKDTQQRFRESPAYGKQAFFITYVEDKRIFGHQSYNHSSYTFGRTEVALWDKEE